MNSAFEIRNATWEEHREQLLSVRTEVFVHEQNVPAEIEIDDYDPVSEHVLAIELLTGNPIGTARLLPAGKIGRVAVRKPWRKHGIGAALMESLIERAEKLGMPELTLHGQTRTVGFYETFGFACEGDEFLEADIPHYKMRLRL